MTKVLPLGALILLLLAPCAGRAQDAKPPSGVALYHELSSVQLDPERVGLNASKIAEEVIAHLAGQVGAKVVVTLEIEARLPNGVSEQLIRTVTENSQTLRFGSHGFERD